MSVPGNWIESNTYHHRQFEQAELLDAKRREGLSLSLCLPAREVADTVGPILDCIEELKQCGLVDQVIVVDAASADGTAAVAAEHGATVYQEDELVDGLGPCRGKGDAMWRALRLLYGDLIAFVDADTTDFGAHYVSGLFGPLLLDSGIQFVKGAYRRPLTVGDVRQEDGGGRVTELCARPLLNHFYPELSGFLQPLSGEVAARRSLLEELPFSTGYAVEIAMLIDAYRKAGLDALAQVYLESRENSHQGLRDLGPMAYEILMAVCRRLEGEGRMDEVGHSEYLLPAFDGAGICKELSVEVLERPALRSFSEVAQ